MLSVRDRSQFDAGYRLGYSKALEEQGRVGILEENVVANVHERGVLVSNQDGEERAWAMPRSEGLKAPPCRRG